MARVTIKPPRRSRLWLSQPRLSVHRLPAYAPDYNLIEPLWRNVKRDKTHHRSFPSFEALVQAVEKGMTGFQQDPAAVRQLMGPYRQEAGMGTTYMIWQ